MGTAILFPQDCLQPRSGHKHRTSGMIYPPECAPGSKRDLLPAAQRHEAGLLPLPAHGGHSSPMDLSQRGSDTSLLKLRTGPEQRDVNHPSRFVSDVPSYKILQRPKQGDVAVNLLAQLFMLDEVKAQSVTVVAKASSTKGSQNDCLDSADKCIRRGKAEFVTLEVAVDGFNRKSWSSDSKPVKCCDGDGSLGPPDDLSEFLNGLDTLYGEGYKLPGTKVGALKTEDVMLQSGLDDSMRFSPPKVLPKPLMTKAAGTVHNRSGMDRIVQRSEELGSTLPPLRRTSTEPQISAQLRGQYKDMSDEFSFSPEWAARATPEERDQCMTYWISQENTPVPTPPAGGTPTTSTPYGGTPYGGTPYGGTPRATTPRGTTTSVPASPAGSGSSRSGRRRRSGSGSGGGGGGGLCCGDRDVDVHTPTRSRHRSSSEASGATPIGSPIGGTPTSVASPRTPWGPRGTSLQYTVRDGALVMDEAGSQVRSRIRQLCTIQFAHSIMTTWKNQDKSKINYIVDTIHAEFEPAPGSVRLPNVWITTAARDCMSHRRSLVRSAMKAGGEKPAWLDAEEWDEVAREMRSDPDRWRQQREAAGSRLASAGASHLGSGGYDTLRYEFEQCVGREPTRDEETRGYRHGIVSLLEDVETQGEVVHWERLPRYYREAAD